MNGEGDSGDWYNISVSSVTSTGATINSANVSASPDADTTVENTVINGNTISVNASDGTTGDSGAVNFTVNLGYDTSGLFTESTGLSYSVNQYNNSTTTTSSDSVTVSSFTIADNSAQKPNSANATDPITASNNNSISVDVSFSSSLAEGGTLNVTFTDSGGTTYEATKSVSSGSSTYTISGIDLTQSSLSDGSVNVSAKFTDSQSNSQGYTSTLDTVTKDTVAPSVSANSGNIPSYFTGSSVDLTSYFSINNDDGGTTTYEYKLNSNSYTTVDSTNETGFNTSKFADGDNLTFRATDTDNVGNQDQATTASVAIDLNSPQFSSPNPQDSSVVSNNSTAYSVTLSDTTSGVNTGTISVTVTDSNTSDGEELNAAGTGNQHINYYSSNNSLEITGMTYADGQVNVTVNADDEAGNSATFSSSFTVDTTAPTVSSVSISESDGIVKDGDTVTVSADVSDANGVSVTADASSFGAGSVTLTQDSGTTYTGSFNVGSKTAASEGEQSVTVSATDAAGNGGSQAVESNNLTVDTTDPSVSISNPSGGEVVQVQSFINGSASDTGSGVSSVSVAFSSGNSGFGGPATYDSETGTWSYNVGSLSDGSYNVTATATDVAGNSIDSNSITFTVDSKIDTANIQTLSDTEVSGGDTVTVTYDAKDARFSTAEILVENSTGALISSKEVTSQGTGTGLTADITAPSSEGDYTVKLRVNDTVGNTKTTSGTTLSVDNTAPSPVINSISDQIVQSSTSFSVNYNATTNDINSVTVAIVDSSGDVTTVTGSTGSEVTDSITSPSSTGSYSIEVRATDDAGNVGTSSQKSLTVDDTVPSVSSIEVVDRDRDGSVDAANVTFSEAVDDSSISPAQWTIGAKTAASYDTGSTADDAKLQIQLASDNQISGTAVRDVTTGAPTLTDLAGNTLGSVSSSTVVEKDEANPVINLNKGLNLVSFPISDNSDLTVSEVLEEGKTNKVWKYDAVSDSWKAWTPEKADNSGFSFSIQAGQGYIVNASSSYTETPEVDELSGKTPTPSYRFGDGWNLVGHFKEAPQTVTDGTGAATSTGALGQIGDMSVVNEINDNTGTGTLDYSVIGSDAKFQPGEAYWVRTDSVISGGYPIDYLPN